jgi:adenylate cyclase, class 2
MDEIELKFLDIDVKEIKDKLKNIGAQKKYSAYTESYPFIAEGYHSNKSDQKYLRVRKVNNEITITYKEPAKDSKTTNREEIEIKVSDYDKAILILERLGFQKGKVFKKHRAHYELGNVHFELDTLDNVPTYLEIETQTEEEMEKICKKLNLNIADGKKGTIVEILPELFEL